MFVEVQARTRPTNIMHQSKQSLPYKMLYWGQEAVSNVHEPIAKA
jgi:hypothetical protein